MIDPQEFIRQKEQEAAQCLHPSLCGVWLFGRTTPFYRCNKCFGFVRDLTAAEIEEALTLTEENKIEPKSSND